MKRWNRLLAVVLAVITVAAMLPMSVFAEQWARVEAKNENGDYRLTVTVNADQLKALIESGELFGGEGGILSGVSIDTDSLLEIFSPDELLEIIPKDVLLEHFDTTALASDVDPEKIMDYIEDYEALLAGCDLTKLPDFLPENAELSGIFSFDILMNYVDFEDAYDYLIDADLKKLFNDRLKTDGVVETFIESLSEKNVKLTDVIYFSELLKDKVIVLNTDAVSMDSIKNSGLINFGDPDLANKLITAEVFDLAGLESFMKTLPNAKSYFDTDKVLNLLDINDYIGDFHYEDFDIDFSVFTEDHLNKDELVEEDYTVDPETGAVSLTEDGKEKIAANPTKYLTDEGMDLLEAQVSLEEDIYPLIDTERLIADVGGISVLASCLIVDRAIEIQGINAYINYSKLVDFVGGPNAVIDSGIAVDYKKLDLAGLQNVTDVNQYVNSDNLLNKNIVPREILYEAAGGEAALLDCVDTAALFRDKELLNRVITAINKDPEVEMTDVVNISNFINTVTDKQALVTFIGIDKVLEQLDNTEIEEILETVSDIFAYVKDQKALFDAVIKEVYWVVDLLTVDGEVIAEEDPETAALEIKPKALLQTLRRLVPSLGELAALEGNTLFTANLGIVFQGEAATEPSEKSIELSLVLEGDIDALKTAAGKLDKLLRTYFDFSYSQNGDISLGIHLPEIKTPAKLATFYETILDSDKISEETMEKLLGFADSELDGFIETLELEDAAEILGAVDPERLYDAILSISYVEKVLAKLEAKTGLTLAGLTLDEMKDQLLTVPSAERVSEIIAERTGRDVMAILEGAAESFDGLSENVMVERMLTLVGEKLGIDVSEISATEILDRVSDDEISERIADEISKRVGRDVMEILQSNTASELYDLAVAKATESKDRFEKVQNYVTKIIGYLPDEIAELRISDWYRGNGDFGGEISFDVSYKKAAEKIAKKLLQKIKPDLSEEALSKVMGRIPDGTLNCTVEIDNLHVTDVYQITYMDRKGEEVLLRAYLPVGADLTVFKNKAPDWFGYTFTGWADEDGVELTEMPARDVTVYADLASVEVKLYDTDGAFLTQIYVETGRRIDAALVAEIEELVTLHEANTHLHEHFHILWKNDGEEGINLGTKTFTEDTELWAYLKPDYYLEIEGEYEYEVVYEDDRMSLLVLDYTFPELDEARFVLSRDNVLKAFMEGRISADTVLTFGFADDGRGERIDFFEMDLAMIRQLYNATGEGDEIFLEYRHLDADEIEHSMYEGLDDAIFYDFNIYVLRKNGTEREVLDLGIFTGRMTIHTPFDDAIVNAVDGQKQTVVHVLGDVSREYISSLSTVGRTRFNAPHFSQFAIGTEYKVTQKFLFAQNDRPVPGNCYLNGVTDTYPKGATFALDPVFDAQYELDRIEVSGGTLSEDQKTFTTPEEGAAVTITVYLKQAEASVYYFVNGKLYRTVSYRDKQTFVPLDIQTVINDPAVKAPAGYTKAEAKWIGYDASKLGIEDIYVFAEWSPIEYTVNFVSKETETTVSIPFTIEDYQNVVAPAVPPVAGMTGAWEAYDLSKLFSGGEITLTVNAVYTPRTYTVIVHYSNGENDAVLQAVPEETVSIPKVAPEFYTVTVKAFDEDGNEITVTNWTLTMPSSTVYVTVQYTPVPVTYTVNGVRHEGVYNETVSILIPVAKGQMLASISGDCRYVGRTENADGSVTMRYQLLLDALDCSVTYKIRKVSEPSLRVLNGNLYSGLRTPVSDHKNVEFAGWMSGVGGLKFATFQYDEAGAMLWLWILLIAVILLAFIALIYLLHVKGRMGKNILTCVAVAIVHFFFKICLGVYGFGLKLLSLFGKSKDPAAYGVGEKKEEPKEAPAAPEKPKQVPPAPKKKKGKKKRKVSKKPGVKDKKRARDRKRKSSRKSKR